MVLQQFAGTIAWDVIPDKKRDLVALCNASVAATGYAFDSSAFQRQSWGLQRDGGTCNNPHASTALVKNDVAL